MCGPNVFFSIDKNVYVAVYEECFVMYNTECPDRVHDCCVMDVTES